MFLAQGRHRFIFLILRFIKSLCVRTREKFPVFREPFFFSSRELFGQQLSPAGELGGFVLVLTGRFREAQTGNIGYGFPHTKLTLHSFLPLPAYFCIHTIVQ